MNRRPRARRTWPALAPCLAAVGAVVAADDELRFVRVNVPADALAEVPLDDVRHVPMPLAAFEEAVARLGPSGDRFHAGTAAEADYELAPGADGGLAGRVTFRISPESWQPGLVPLGRLAAGRCTVRTGDGEGEAAVFCQSDGTVAVRTPGPATYSCDIRLPPEPTGTVTLLPLLPALATTVALDLPENVRPIVVGPVAALIERAPDGSSRWRIRLGPVDRRDGLPLVLDDGRRPPPPVRAWSSVTVLGRQARIVTRLEPAAAWTPGRLRVATAAGVTIADVVSEGDVEPLAWVATDEGIAIEIPPRLAGGRQGVVVGGIVPVTATEPMTLPVLAPVAARWGGSATRLAVDPSFAIQRLRLHESRAVPPRVAERWPLASADTPPPAAGVEPATLFLEHQVPGAEAHVVIGPRAGGLDAARVTTVDILRGKVLARTAVDVRVVAGQVFEIVADVPRDWLIDSVETVDWATGPETSEGVVLADRSPEWRVVSSPRGNELRIGLPEAATPRRPLGLRITGHRAGVALGQEFSSDEMDMVRFPGEAALLEFQLEPTAVLETADGSLDLEPVPERLVPLLALTAPRARIRSGERAPAVRARLVRRRPPVEVTVGVDLVARDDRLAETFSFDCRPVAGELDAVVVHFSEAMGPGLEWSLADGGGSLAAQRLDPGDTARGEMRSDPAVAESWLVELRPATAVGASFRAGRNIALEDAVPVPLAWVEAAVQPGGTVSVRGEPGRRPDVVNRRLRELPPSAAGEPGVVELAYGPPRSVAGDGPAAEVAAALPTAEPRAWAWHQRSTCWCHDSGGLEWETELDVENHGRETATLSLPEGLRVDAVSVGGEAVAIAPVSSDGRSLEVPLPRAAVRLRLVVRGTGARDGRLGWWRVGEIACGIDMPVLGREVSLMLPPSLTLAEPGGAADRGDWIARLFGASAAPASAAAEQGGTRLGFRAVAIPAATGTADRIVVRRPLVTSLAILVAVAGGLTTLGLARRGGPTVIVVCGLAAVAALWSAGPWDAMARAALWGGVAGAWVGGRGPATARRAAAAIVALLLAAHPVAAAESPPAPRVYVTSGADGGTALVPEPIFRRLAAATAALGPPSVRVLSSDVTADVETGVWRVRFELDADQGGGLRLDQGPTGAAWRLATPSPRELSVTIDAEGRAVVVAATAAGRYGLELDVLPARGRLGDLETAAIALPPCPRARLGLVESEGGGRSGWQCDRGIAAGPWLPVAEEGGSFDLSAAARVRLVRPADPRATPLAAVRTAVSFNDVAWQDDGIRLTATFDVGGERQIVRSLVVAADPLLQPISTGPDDPTPRPIGGGRHAVEIPQPRAGQRRVVIAFRMPLADPVGVFAVPSVWLVGAETDVRTVRLRPAADLLVAPELPAGMSLVRPREEDGTGTAAVWRSDALAAAEGSAPAAEPRATIVVTRRARRPTAVQDLAVEFADDHVAMRLRCLIDAADEPVSEVALTVPPAAIIDGIVLTREPSAGDGGGPRTRSDLFWYRAAADRIVAVAQRPDAGRFRLELEARLPIRPAGRGRLPVARIAADDLPLEVTCRAADGAGVSLAADEPGAVATLDRIELAPGEPAPGYTLVRDPPPRPLTPADTAVAPGPGPPDPSATVTTSIDLVFDGTGRAWGLARLELVSPKPVVRLVLPTGLRLFDVRADGREVAVLPGPANAWDVRLHDVGWPRTLVALIAGTLGGRPADGAAIRLDPPRLEGLPAGTVLWSLDAPAGFAVRVFEPARVVDAGGYASLRETARGGIAEVFREAVRRAPPGQRERLEALVDSRHSGGGPADEPGWYEAWRGSAAVAAEPTLVATGADGTVTFRVVAAHRERVVGRGAATLVVLGIALACWLAARRFPAVAGHTAAVVRRWWWLACGACWLATLEPALPGVVMILVGLAVAGAPLVTRAAVDRDEDAVD